MALLHALKVSLGFASVSETEQDTLLHPPYMAFNHFNEHLVSVKGSPRDTHGLFQGMLMVEKPPLWCHCLLAFLLGTWHKGACLGAHSVVWGCTSQGSGWLTGETGQPQQESFPFSHIPCRKRRSVIRLCEVKQSHMKCSFAVVCLNLCSPAPGPAHWLLSIGV